MKPDVVRHGKVTTKYRKSLRKPTTLDFDLLVTASISAVVSDEEDVIVAFGYTMKFPAKFPRGICIKRNLDGSNIHRVKAKRLLEWLHANGHTVANVEAIGMQKRSFYWSTREFDKLFELDFLTSENLEII